MEGSSASMSVTYSEYQDAQTFLVAVRPALERQECTNALALGVCLRLAGDPEAYGSRPYLATVESAGRLCVAAVMTPPYNLLLACEDEGDSVAGLDLVVEGLRRGAWRVPGLIAPESTAEAFAVVWAGKTGARWRVVMRQGVHELRRVVHPAYPAGEIRPATAEDMPLVRRWARGFHEDCFGGDPEGRSIKEGEASVERGALFFWVDGEPVSMAARSRPTPHGESVGLVYTPPERRRRGYATALVAQLSQRILDDGRQFCTLHTDLSNPSSNHIYGSIGYVKVAEVVEVHFEEVIAARTG